MVTVLHLRKAITFSCPRNFTIMLKVVTLFRKVVCGGPKDTLFEHYPEIFRMSEEAFDHAAIWEEIAV
jgi:hypothetical protein